MAKSKLTAEFQKCGHKNEQKEKKLQRQEKQSTECIRDSERL